MKELLVTSLLALLVTTAPDVERKAPEDVDIDALVTETQKSAEPTPGLNIVWFIPVEFWEVTFAQDPEIDKEGVAELLEALRDNNVIAVLRADISELGAFSFHSKQAVSDSMTVMWTPEGGEPMQIAIQEKVSSYTTLVLDMFQPLLQQGLGDMGESFHFLVYDAHDAQGKRIASPYDQGTLSVNLAKLGQETGGTINIRMPLDSVHVPRQCSKCDLEAHISWNWCPWCGTSLGK